MLCALTAASAAVVGWRFFFFSSVVMAVCVRWRWRRQKEVGGECLGGRCPAVVSSSALIGAGNGDWCELLAVVDALLLVGDDRRQQGG
ncbi:hypothetical protein Dimus_013832 [Dionaea muscipula]